MNASRTELARTLISLQSTAHACARTFGTPDTVVEYRVLYCAGMPHAWRLAEMHRAAGARQGWILRRLHCFNTAQSLQSSLTERTKWKNEDRALVARFKRQTGVLVGEGEVDLGALNAERHALRARMCITRPAQVIELPRDRPAA